MEFTALYIGRSHVGQDDYAKRVKGATASMAKEGWQLYSIHRDWFKSANFAEDQFTFCREEEVDDPSQRTTEQ